MYGLDGELTLEGLAQRLETLERENTELHKEVAALRGADTGTSGPVRREAWSRAGTGRTRRGTMGW